mgnify:CR=1 FL=1
MISPEQYIDGLEWRYACKKFDPEARIEKPTWHALAESLLWQYLQRAPVAESFIWRRWLYVLWDEVAQLVNTGRFNRSNFDLATKSLLPWLA